MQYPYHIHRMHRPGLPRRHPYRRTDTGSHLNDKKNVAARLWTTTFVHSWEGCLTDSLTHYTRSSCLQALTTCAEVKNVSYASRSRG